MALPTRQTRRVPAALSVAGLAAAVVMVRAARGRRPQPGSRSSA